MSDVAVRMCTGSLCLSNDSAEDIELEEGIFALEEVLDVGAELSEKNQEQEFGAQFPPRIPDINVLLVALRSS